VTESAFVSSVAFFPWVALAEPISLGRSVRLLPHKKGRAPGDTDLAKQADLDNVLRAYSNGTHWRVSEATLIEADGWRTGMDADDATRERLFRARIILGFSALSYRRLFSPRAKRRAMSSPHVATRAITAPTASRCVSHSW